MSVRSGNRVVLGHAALHTLAAGIFASAGMVQEDADTVAEALVWANLHGVDSHGVQRIPRYLELIASGELDPGARPIVEPLRAAAFLVHGARAAGPVAMMRAMPAALEMAQEAGTAFGVVQRTTHTGAIGRYARWAAERGFAAIVTSSGPPNMAYHGARTPSLSTSPIAIAVPRGEDGVLALDMATSIAALGKINAAAAAGAAIPEGWALDDGGNPTTDAAKATVALPLGGPKGAGLALLFECLASVMAGSAILAPALVSPVYRHIQSATITVVDVSAFRPRAEYRRDIDELRRRIKALPRRDGVAELLLPGERADRAFRARHKSGIPLPLRLWHTLARIAEERRVAVPETETSNDQREDA